jgi:hypothetical protein
MLQGNYEGAHNALMYSIFADPEAILPRFTALQVLIYQERLHDAIQSTQELVDMVNGLHPDNSLRGIATSALKHLYCWVLDEGGVLYLPELKLRQPPNANTIEDTTALSNLGEHQLQDSYEDSQ